MEKKQTAVEWLVQELKKSSNYRGLQNIGITHQELFEQAKEMEKQQIIDANEDASTNELGEFLTGKQYYNQEFGDNSKQVQPKEVDLGEMINVWIEHHGFLDLSTDEQEIINFYNKIQGGNK